MGQDPEVALYASQYSKSMILATVCFGQFDLMKRFLIQLQVSWVPMIAQVITTLLHILWCYIFVIKLDMQVLGAAYAMAVTCTLSFTSVTVFAYFVPRIRKALFAPTLESLNDWGEYFSISIPATIMVCAEWWCFELFVLASSYLGVAYLAANVIMQNISAMMFMFPLGF